MGSSRSSLTASAASFSLRGIGALLGEVDVLHVLLGDRRAALLHVLVAQVRPERASDAHRIHPAVVVELAILCGQHRVDQHRWQPVVGDVDAVDATAELCDGVVLVAVGGHLGRADERGLELRGIGVGKRHLAEEVADPGQPEHEQKGQQEPGPTPAPDQGALLRTTLPTVVASAHRARVGRGGAGHQTFTPNGPGSTRRCGPGGSSGTRGTPRRRSRRTHPIDAARPFSSVAEVMQRP